MNYDGTDPHSNFEDYQGVFWHYLNYSYIRPEWTLWREWKK
jgi:hypothetical protein